MVTIIHNILVYLPDLSKGKNSINPIILSSRAGAYAEKALAFFEPAVFDQKAPVQYSFMDRYETHVMMGTFYKNYSIEVLKDVLSFQQSEITYCLSMIKAETGMGLKEIFDDLYSTDPRLDYTYIMEYIRCAAQFLSGEYQISSRFYNTKKKTARLLPEDIDAIRQHPEDWALVKFALTKEYRGNSAINSQHLKENLMKAIKIA
uniref:hypothetical protein n=1 Tax=Lachnoclostridium phocaeense TaxID=1871021 RepID=UPI0026DDBAFD|nr:hypothetical protein [Lachnoclostridium phocaeense]